MKKINFNIGNFYFEITDVGDGYRYSTTLNGATVADKMVYGYFTEIFTVIKNLLILIEPNTNGAEPFVHYEQFSRAVRKAFVTF